jgi:hypothetical protein
MSKKPFKTLLGNRIVIENFAKPSSEVLKEEEAVKPVIELIGEAKAEKELKSEEEKMSTERFKILQVGAECNKEFKVGQEIYIENALSVLNPERSEVIIEDGVIVAFIIPERSIAGIY